jgi:hypothetical protein
LISTADDPDVAQDLLQGLEVVEAVPRVKMGNWYGLLP